MDKKLTELNDMFDEIYLVGILHEYFDDMACIEFEINVAAKNKYCSLYCNAKKLFITWGDSEMETHIVPSCDREKKYSHLFATDQISTLRVNGNITSFSAYD